MSTGQTSKLKRKPIIHVVLTSREKTAIIVSHLVSLYSEKMERGKVSNSQSVIDFIIKNIPQEHKPDISIDLIDDVFNFISSRPMELS
jgi:hypothetical protein